MRRGLPAYSCGQWSMTCSSRAPTNPAITTHVAASEKCSGLSPLRLPSRAANHRPTPMAKATITPYQRRAKWPSRTMTGSIPIVIMKSQLHSMRDAAAGLLPREDQTKSQYRSDQRHDRGAGDFGKRFSTIQDVELAAGFLHRDRLPARRVGAAAVSAGRG